MPDRPVIGLDFSAALEGRIPPKGGVVFVTNPKSLATFGPLWALALQDSVEEWDQNSSVLIDGNLAPAYGIEALKHGLKNLVIVPELPVFSDVKLYADEVGAILHQAAPKPTDTWQPLVPLRKSAKSRR